MRCPADSGIGEIDPSTQKMRFVEYADMTYITALEEHPMYASYLAQEKKPEHLAGRKFPTRITMKEEGVATQSRFGYIKKEQSG